MAAPPPSKKALAAKLHNAAEKGSVDDILAALRAGASADALRPADGLSALHIVACAGRADLVTALLAGGATVDRSREEDGRSALHCVCEEAAGLDTARALLAGGADPNRRDFAGWTPLHCAAYMGADTYTQLLLANGAKADAVDECGQTPMAVAAEACGTKWVGRDCNYAEVARQLLTAGVSPSTAADMFDAPLHLAARAGNAAFAKALVDGGADIDAKTGAAAGGCTALHIASAGGDGDLLAVLLAAGASIEICDGDGGFTALQLAVQGSRDGAVAQLLQAGASPHTPCNTGLTAVHMAAQLGNAAALQLLLDAAPKQAPPPQLQSSAAGPAAPAPSPARATPLPTPLHMACHGGHTSVVEVLLAHGATADAVDVAGDTPLHIAYRAGHTSVAELLLACSSGQAAAAVRNAKGELPRDTASS